MSKSLSLSILRWSLCLLLLSGIGLVSLHAASTSVMVDFEGGLPLGWFTFFGGSSVSTVTQTVPDNDALARPGQVGDNDILSVDYNVFDFGGLGQDLTAVGGPQNWINFESFDFLVLRQRQRSGLSGRDLGQSLGSQHRHLRALRLRIHGHHCRLAVHQHSLQRFHPRHGFPAARGTKRRFYADRDLGLGHRAASWD